MKMRLNIHSLPILLMVALSTTGISLSGQASAASQTALEYCEPFDTDTPDFESFSGFTAVGNTEILKQQGASEFDSLLPLENRCVVNPDVYSCACSDTGTYQIDMS